MHIVNTKLFYFILEERAGGRVRGLHQVRGPRDG